MGVSKYPVNKYPELYFIEIFSNAIAIIPLMYSGYPYLCMLALSISVHLELAINSICHFPLKQKKQRQENDRSQNTCHAKDVWWVGILNGGEGFHGAHHDRPRCAYHGRWNKAYNLDVAYLIICGLESLGVCWDVVHDEGNNEIIKEKTRKTCISVLENLLRRNISSSTSFRVKRRKTKRRGKLLHG